MQILSQKSMAEDTGSFSYLDSFKQEKLNLNNILQENSKSFVQFSVLLLIILTSTNSESTYFNFVRY